MLLLEELVIPENGLNLPTIADQDQSSEKEIGISIKISPQKSQVRTQRPSTSEL